MKNFVFGLTAGAVVGVTGSFVAMILTMVVVEDSPETLKILADSFHNA